MWSPLPPAASGIADYTAEFIHALAGHFIDLDLTIYSNPDADAAPFARLPVTVRSYFDYAHDQFRAASPAPDVQVYHMGNSARFHTEIYAQLQRVPGVVILHDLALFGFHLHGQYYRGQREAFLSELLYQHGEEAARNAQRYVRGALDTWLDVPMHRRVIESSLATIVHTRYAADFLRERYPNAAVSVVIPGAKLLDRRARPAIRARYGWSDEQFVIGVFGEISPHKRPHLMLEAFPRVREVLPTARLVIAGRRGEHPSYPTTLRRMAHARHLRDSVTWATDVPLATLEALIQAADVVVNLRWPTAGEVSGILMRALGAGTPVICTDVPHLREWPAAFCWRIPVGAGEREALVERLVAAAHDQAYLTEASQAAQAFARQHAAWEIAAGRYLAAIESVLA
jgi:glycosyltransferase involved in cell wall biosynthesis